MLEPVGNKSQNHLPKLMEKVHCPTENAPYIFTNKNSKRYHDYGHQDGLIP